ncbi:MAG TPA: DNA-processing protein DprA [Fimbriimonadaceae bacterium]|jgi:predicted Rossmann fold nucleotide-binding protein DprA/Smf involved in DNA uptake
MEVSDHTIATTLTALYLIGAREGPPSPRQKWQGIERTLREESPSLEEVERLLKSSGYWLESGVLATPGVIAKAERLVRGGKVLTSNMESYPGRWLRVLGGLAPPALWLQGAFPLEEFFTVVGSRDTTPAALKFAGEAGEEAVHRGFAVASGGAYGCDRAAARGAMRAVNAAGAGVKVVEILPYGIELARVRNTIQVSLCAPREIFSGPAAMERNRLLYALSDRSLVAAVRFKEGGTWRGACECLRRRSSTILVRDDGSEGVRALQGLGAVPVRTIEDVFEVEAEELRPVLGMF